MIRSALFLLVLLTLPTTPVLAQETSLYMDSEPGDYIGQGQEWYYTPESADFIANQIGSLNGVSVNLSNIDPWGWWNLNFTAPAGTELTVGEYTGATRYPFNDPDEPGLSISGMGRGCNTLTGNFYVHEITFGPDNTVETFWATFEQHCEGGDPALIGEIRFNAGVVATLNVNWGDLKGCSVDIVGRYNWWSQINGDPIETVSTDQQSFPDWQLRERFGYIIPSTPTDTRTLGSIKAIYK